MATQVIKTVNPLGGKQYTSLTAALASLPFNLVTNDLDVEIVLDKAIYSEGIFISGYTTDATHRIRIRCATGASFYDNPNKLTSKLRPNPASGVYFDLPGQFLNPTSLVESDYVFIDGLQFTAGSTHTDMINWGGNKGMLSRCIFVETSSAAQGCLVRMTGDSTVVEVLTIKEHDNDNIGRGGFVLLYENLAINCGAITTVPTDQAGFNQGYATGVVWKNCFSFGYARFARSTVGGPGSASNASDTSGANTPGVNKISNLVFADQFQNIQAGTGDYRLKQGSALATGGVRQQAYTDDLDILKNAISTTTPPIGPVSYFSVQANSDSESPVMVGDFTITDIVPNGYTLSWPAATDNVGVTGYLLSVDGGDNINPIGNVLTRQVTGRTPGNTDQVLLFAVDAAGNMSENLLSAEITLPDAAPDDQQPVMNGDLMFSNVTQTGYTFAWQNATDNVGVAGYEYNLDGSDNYIALGNVNAMGASGRTAGATDQVRVRAYDAAGNRSAVPLEGSVTLQVENGSLDCGIMVNSSNSVLVNTVFKWSWFSVGRIGELTGKLLVEGTTSSDADGRLIVPDLPVGQGVLLARRSGNDAYDDGVYYQPGEVA